MGVNNFKSELETELEKAFESRGIYFCEVKEETLRKFLERDTDAFAEYYSKDEQHEFLPPELECYLRQQSAGLEKTMKEMFKKFEHAFLSIILNGVFRMHNEASADKQGFFKQRIAEANQYIIDYKPVVWNLDEAEKEYKENNLMELLHISKIVNDKYESVLYCIYSDNKLTHIGPGEKYETQFKPFKKYKKGRKLPAKEFANDLMKLIGA